MIILNDSRGCMDKKYKIVFMGTADFSASQLETLIQSDKFEIPFVVSQPDKKVGRKQTLTETEVKKVANKYNIEVKQTRKLRDGVLANQIKEANVDLILVVAYGRLLPKDVLDSAKMGALNVHASLLPKYRGACPIQMSLFAGEKMTGITYMRMAEGLDEGNILRQIPLELDHEINSAELFSTLSKLSSQHLVEFLQDFFAGDIEERIQDNSEATIVKPLNKDDAEINWSWSAQKVHNLVRAMNDWPLAYTFLNNKRVQILRGKVASYDDLDNNLQAIYEKSNCGDILANKHQIFVKCNNSLYQILQLRLEGAKLFTANQLAHNFRSGKSFSFDVNKCGPKIYKFGEDK